MKSNAPLHPWLSSLLEAYAFLDASLAGELLRGGRAPACGPGCTVCCGLCIPVSAAELMGIRIFLETLQAAHAARQSLPGACRFLTPEGTCAVYPVRPFACRRFLVYGAPCAPLEDPTITRPHDVHAPSARALLHAQRLTLPFYRHYGFAIPLGEPEQSFFTAHSLLLKDAPF